MGGEEKAYIPVPVSIFYIRKLLDKNPEVTLGAGSGT